MASSKSLSSAFEKIGRYHFECGICTDRFQDPKILDCLHSFCLRCLQNHISKSCQGSSKIACPVCRSQTQLPESGVGGLRTNVHLVSLMEEFAVQEKQVCSDGEKLVCEICEEEKEATHRCLDCAQNMCSICGKRHPRCAGTSNHTVLTLDEIRKENLQPSKKYNKLIQQDLKLMQQEVRNKAEELRKEITKQENAIIQEINKIKEERKQKLDETCEIEKTLHVLEERIQHSLETTKDLASTAVGSDFLSLYSTLSKDLKLLSGQNTPRVDSRLPYLRFVQRQGVGDIDLGKLVTIGGKWELCRDIGKEGSGPGEFDWACDVAVLQHDEIAVEDVNNRRVQILSWDGNIKRQISFQKLTRGIAVSQPGNRLVAVCLIPPKVQVFNQDNSLAFEFSTVAAGEVGKTSVVIQSVAVKQNGNILVGAWDGTRFYVLTEHSPTNGALLRTILVGIMPCYLAAGSDDNLVISSGDEVVDVTDCDGATLFNIKPTIGGQPVKRCTGVYSDSELGIYIAVGNERVTGHIHHYDAQGGFLACIAQGLFGPLGITMTPEGQLVVADYNSVKIYQKLWSYLRFEQRQGVGDISLGKLVTAGGKWELCRQIGQNGRWLNGFAEPRGVAVREHDEIAVTDNWQHVQILSVDGKIKSRIPLKYPYDIAVSQPGNRLVTVSPYARTVHVFDQDNSLAFEFSTVADGEYMEFPVNLGSVAVKQNGNILVGDTERKVLTEHSPTNGALLRTIPVEIEPHFLAAGSNDSIVINSLGKVVHVTDCNGATLFTIKPTIGGHPVSSCQGVYSDSELGIYIAVSDYSTGSHHIHHYDAQGGFLTCIVQGLHYPQGITMTPEGQLVVVDDNSVKIYQEIWS